MQRFVACDSFWELFPEAQIGVVVVRDLPPASEVGPEARAEISRLLARANDGAERWMENPQVSKNRFAAVWRDAYRKFKTKGGARVAVENLIKRAAKGNPVGEIFPLVDVTNALSMRYAFPIGVENLDAVVGDFTLRVTEGGDDFDPLGEGNDPTLPGELAYMDDMGAICRCWNWRDGQRTGIDETTRNAVAMVENVDPERADDLVAMTEEVAEKLARLLGGTVTAKAVVTIDNREVTLVE